MSLLPCSTYAGPSQAEALWAVAGSVGPGGGVTQLVAGTGVTLAPSTGEGVVTISATGGGGGVTSIVAGAGIGVSSPAGDVTVSNTGVTSLVAGTGITLSGGTGAVTVTNSFASGLPTLTYSSLTVASAIGLETVTQNVIKLTLAPLDATRYSAFIWNNSWSENDVFTVSVVAGPIAGGNPIPGLADCQFASAGPGVPRLSVGYSAVSAIAGATAPILFIIRYAGNPV